MGKVIRTETITRQKAMRISLLTAYYFLHPYSLISDVIFNTLRALHLSVQSPGVTSSAALDRGHPAYAPERSFFAAPWLEPCGLRGYA